MKHLFLAVLGLLSLQWVHSRSDDRTNCKPFTASFCQGVGYTTTLHPTGVQGYNLQQIGQIVETACSPHVAKLMCRIVVPECSSEDDSRLKPCRALCVQVKADCESTLRAKWLSWPLRLRCETLPESNCVGASSVVSVIQTPPSACQPITVPFCKDTTYTETVLPGQETQDNIALTINRFNPLVTSGCSPHLKPFLCSVYVPECVSGKPRPPCRTLCEHARSHCGAQMRSLSLEWPEALKCEAFTTESCEHVPVISVSQAPSAACQPITVPLCKDLHYTETVLPEKETQDVISLKINQFYPLVKVECSSHLKPLLCSIFVPECVSGKPRPPCRTLCEKAKSGCEPLMNKFGIPWPEELKCTAFTTESCEHYGVSSSGGVCEPITIPMCQGLSYNQTLIPNLLGHTSQREAFTKMSFFNSMVQTVCSVDIRIFLCRVYAPQCEAGQAQWPCRSFCEKARRDCEGLMSNFGISWPEELQCSSFPEEMCISEEKRSKMLNAEDVAAKLEAGGYSVHGKALTLSTARLLLTLMDADQSGDLDVVEFFKLERFVGAIRREYVESYGSRNQPSVTENQMKKALVAREFHLDDETFRVLWQEYRSEGGINYDKYVAALAKLQILKDRFKAHLLNLPCDCQVASFTMNQFMKTAIV
ncbi:atrial natriuretic peptide-converting enzyme-like [Astatotilapia calliptera]|uniref:atrial natriuretic peptide-converting enzyme-like n=1 Tax=Astatotilapia calliptera TaxID=8154 RepID=UPI000E42015C|nr:atrial natriuretic peptide-converting enzyme-like [Astatotilapia calliptera]